MSILLTSRSQAKQFIRSLEGIERGFEAFLLIAWKASRIELVNIFQDIAAAGVHVLHVRWISPDFVVHGPLELFSLENKLVALYDYPCPGDTYILCSLRERERGVIGLLLN